MKERPAPQACQQPWPDSAPLHPAKQPAASTAVEPFIYWCVRSAPARFKWMALFWPQGSSRRPTRLAEASPGSKGRCALRFTPPFDLGPLASASLRLGGGGPGAVVGCWLPPYQGSRFPGVLLPWLGGWGSQLSSAASSPPVSSAAACPRSSAKLTSSHPCDLSHGASPSGSGLGTANTTPGPACGRRAQGQSVSCPGVRVSCITVVVASLLLYHKTVFIWAIAVRKSPDISN